jgi:hypothetical protein
MRAASNGRLEQLAMASALLPCWKEPESGKRPLVPVRVLEPAARQASREPGFLQ